VSGTAGPEDRFIEAIADRRRVCCCICPTTTPAHRNICALFVEAGLVIVLERVGDHYSARCLPCAQVLGYTLRHAARGAGPLPTGTLPLS
jgi:hypothetical protein